MKHLVICVLLVQSFYGLMIFDYRVMALVFSLPFFYWFCRLRKNVELSKSIEHKFIIYLFICIGINFISCWYFRGQSPYLTLRTSMIRNFFPLLVFYYLIHKNYSIKDIEKGLQVLFFIFILCYMMEYFVFYPQEVFFLNSNNVGEKRFRLTGQLILFLGYYYNLNRFLLSRGNRITSCFGVVLGAICILLLGFRSFTLAFIAVSLIMIYRIQGFRLSSIKYLLLFIVLIIAVGQTDFGETIIGNMLERQNSGATLDNEDYIRVKQWEYFTTQHFQNGLERFFGSGIPNLDSSYGKYMESFQGYNNYGEPTGSVAAWVDWGVYGLSWTLGIPAAVMLYLFVIYMVFKKLGNKYIYISSTYLLLLVTSITTVEIFRFGAFAFHGIILYLLYKIKKNENIGINTSIA